MSDVQPLIDLLERMLNLATPKPTVKPEGHPDNIFIDLSEQEKEEFECSICCRILKDPKQCINNDKFCGPCIYVWSVNGENDNHDKCPVCQTRGYYIKCQELGEKIDRKTVKCHIKTCKWRGQLKYLKSHQHTTYTRTGLPYRPNQREEQRFGGGDDHPPLGKDSQNNNERPSRDRDARMQYRAHNTPEERAPSASGRTNLNHSRCTPREMTQVTGQGHERSENNNPSSTTIEETTLLMPRTPRPQSVPLSPGLRSLRTPMLPSIINQSRDTVRQPTTARPVASNLSSESSRTGTGNNNTNSSNSGYGSIRERLRDSRNRLDVLMNTFSSKLERGRRDITDFQGERERRRHEQLEEVRELGRRLGHVATELRGLLEARRSLRDDIDSESNRSSNL